MSTLSHLVSDVCSITFLLTVILTSDVSTLQLPNTTVQWHKYKTTCLSVLSPFPSKLPLLMGGSAPHLTRFLLPIQAHNPNGTSIGSAVFAQVTAECPYTLVWAALSPKIVPSHWRSGPPSNLWFLGSIQAHNRNSISIGSAVFAQMTTVSLYFTMSRPFPIKIAPSHGGIWTPSNTWFPGTNQVPNPNCISIGSAVCAGLTSVTDRQTDHATRSVTIDRIYVRSTGDAV